MQKIREFFKKYKRNIMIIVAIYLMCRTYWYYNHPHALLDSKFWGILESYMVTSIDEKFWLHRTDNLVRLNTTGTKYAGVELDLVYFENENNFDVSHDKQSTLEYPIDNFMNAIKNNQHIWLDYKNLTAENAEVSLKRLNHVLKEYDIDKERCIVESHNFRALKIFHDAGYYTSYYVPVDNKKFLNNKQGEELFIQQVRQAVQSGNVNAVSFPITYYDLVNKIDIDVDYLTWHTGGERWIEFYLL